MRSGYLYILFTDITEMRKVKKGGEIGKGEGVREL